MPKIVSFDCKQFPAPSSLFNKNDRKGEAASTDKSTTYTPKSLTNINIENRSEFISQMKESIDQLRLNSLYGKDRRRFKELVDLKAGVVRPQKPPRIPAKILVGMRKKLKKREQKEREEEKSNADHHLVTDLISGKFRPPKDRYEMRNKEKKIERERERGLMLSRSLKARQGQKPKPFKPPK